jgi:hypothetical protein
VSACGRQIGSVVQVAGKVSFNMFSQPGCSHPLLQLDIFSTRADFARTIHYMMYDICLSLSLQESSSNRTTGIPKCDTHEDIGTPSVSRATDRRGRSTHP